MYVLTKEIDNYLASCRIQRSLDPKTLKAYRIDLKQYAAFVNMAEHPLSRFSILQYLEAASLSYAPKTVKRKLASLRGLSIESDELCKCKAHRSALKTVSCTGSSILGL